MSTRAHFRGFAAIPALFCAAAAAFEPGAGIEIVPPQPDAGTVLRIAVTGRSDDGCTPVLVDVEIDARDVVLRGEQAAAHCPGAAHAWRIDTSKLPPEKLKLPGNGFYRVRFELAPPAGEPARLRGFRLLYAGNDTAAAPRPETGYWWPELGGEFDRGGPGLGMQIEAQADTVAVGVTGYDADGRSHWLFGAGDLSGHVAQVDLDRWENGAGPFDDYRAPESIATAGQVQLEILSPSRVNAWFVRESEGGGLQAEPISMVRFRFAQQPARAWLGAWVVLSESDAGAPALRVQFTTVENLDDGFLLRDADGTSELRCTLEKSRRNSPPQACTFASGRDEARRTVDFSQVGLNEMRGWNGDSQRMLAIKLSR